VSLEKPRRPRRSASAAWHREDQPSFATSVMFVFRRREIGAADLHAGRDLLELRILDAGHRGIDLQLPRTSPWDGRPPAPA
jgi:hypothetical protein